MISMLSNDMKLTITKKNQNKTKQTPPPKKKKKKKKIIITKEPTIKEIFVLIKLQF